MKNSLYDKRHLKEYILYGAIAGILYMIPSWIFMASADYHETYLLFIGSIIFMFVIMLYAYKLSRRRTEYKSAWMMIIASHFAIIVGVIVSALLTLVLCFVYIPGFLSGDSTTILDNAPSFIDMKNRDLILMLFFCATIESFSAGSFIAVLAPYVFKLNQRKDKTAILEKEIPVKKDTQPDM